MVTRFHVFFVLAIIISVSVARPVVGVDLGCSVRVDRLDFPSTVYPSSKFQVTAKVTVTCQKAGDHLNGKATIIDLGSDHTLDSRSFVLGFIPTISPPASITTTTKLIITSPSVPLSPWNLRIMIQVTGYHTSVTTSEDFAIEVTEGQLNIPVSELSVLKNGGFEQGLDGWTPFKGEGAAGHITTSPVIFRSGSSALMMNMYPPRPGSNPLVAAVLGASQTATVSQLRGLQIHAWHHDIVNSVLAAIRLRVQISGLTINYYVAYGPNTEFTRYDTPKSKTVLMSQYSCPKGWCNLDVNVFADFQRLFESQVTFDTFSGTGSRDITVALELLTYLGGGVSEAFWDDVEVIALVPAQTTTQVIVTTSVSSLSSSLTQSTSTIQQTTEQTQTPTQPQLLVGNMGTILIGLVGGIVIVAVVALTMARRARGRVFCVNCGQSLRKGASFCEKCGSAQR